MTIENEKGAKDMLHDKELLRRILEGFHHYLEKGILTKDMEKVYDEVRLGYLLKSKTRCYSIFDFMTLYATTPLEELKPFSGSENKEIQELLKCKIIENGEINIELQHILLETESLEDMQQKEWVKVLHYLRQVDQRPLEQKRKDYEVIRLETMTMQPFISGIALTRLKNRFHLHAPLKQILVDAYQPWKRDEARLCNHCRYPMEKDQVGNYFCISANTCKHYDLKNLKKEETIDTSTEEYWVLKSGFYLFTALPTRFEWHVKELLMQMGLEVEMFPDLEAKGDLCIKLLYDVFIDCKAQRNAEKLFNHLEKDYKTETIDYYVLPHHYYKDKKYRSKLTKLNKEAGDRYRFVDEKMLLDIMEKMQKGVGV